MPGANRKREHERDGVGVTDSSKPLSKEPRPAERVLHHLQVEFDRPGLKAGTRLPTVRELSRQLDVSPATVRNVFQKLAREGKIRTEVGNGTFFIASRGGEKSTLTIGINVALFRKSPPVSSVYKRIYGGIMHGILGTPRPVTVQPLPPEIWGHEDRYREKLPPELEDLDGIILFPLAFSNRLRRHYETHGRPAVNLNPPAISTTADFVSPDFFDASRRLAEAWKAAGRRRIALVVFPELQRSVSVRLRCAGVFAGIAADVGRGIEVRVVTAPELSEEGGAAAVGRMMRDEGFVPDALYAFNDSLAAGALGVLLAEGRSVPGDTSVVAGNAGEVERARGRVLTRMHQPLETMGERLMAMLLGKIENGNAPAPGCVLPMAFIGGGTTTAEENRHLEPAL